MTAGRDPRRIFTPAQRKLIASSQGWRCFVCSEPLPDVWHAHHFIEWANGGPTDTDNGRAVCPACHLVAPVEQPPTFTPREWQADALRDLRRRLAEVDFATVNAAPGAGKTMLAAALFRDLQARGIVERLAVFVPSDELRTQWPTSVRTPFGVYLAKDVPVEPVGHTGTINTYHALGREALELMVREA